MSEKRISLSDGFEDEVKSLDGREYPSRKEMSNIDGLQTGLGDEFARFLRQGGSLLLERVTSLDEKLQTVQNHINEALVDCRNTEESVTSDLKGILAEIDGNPADVRQDTPASPNQPPLSGPDGSRGLPSAH